MRDELVRVIRIFVSSPSDVQAERKVLDEVAKAINRTDGQRAGFRLEVWRWDTNAVPHIGPKPQPAVDAQTPPYDIYLGIMSTRFGTPTDEADSGTEDEFNRALTMWQEAGKPWILFYFDRAPDPQAIDENYEQYGKVRAFRKKLETLGLIGWYAGVEGGNETFRVQVDEHLRNVAAQLIPAKGRNDVSGERPAPARIPPGYLAWLLSDCAGIDLLGMRLKEGQALRLTQVYVPLITSRRDDDSEKRRLSGRVVERAGEPAREPDEKPQLLLDLLDQQSLYVSGPPGSGKSTFARWVAWLCCHGDLPPNQLSGPEGYCESFPESLRGRLPLLVRLRDFHESLPKTPGCDVLTQTQFEQSLANWLVDRKPGGLTWNCLQQQLAAGRGLLIFDGVDEVPLDAGDSHRAYYPRAMLLAGLAAAVPTWTQAGNRVLVTSRPYGLTDADRGRLGLMHAPLSDLDNNLQRLLVRRWFGILADDQAKGDGLAAEFQSHVEQRRDIGELLANPMLLTAVCIIFNEGRRLPQDRHELYARIVENVLYARFRTPPQIALHRNRLCVIAHAMHTGEGLGESRSTPRAETTISEVDRALSTYQQKKLYTEEGFLGVTQTREKLLSDSGLLLPRDGSKAAFYHLSIQEHLAAQWLLEREEPDLVGVFASRSAAPEWRHTLSFAYGALLSRYEEPTKAVQLLESLLERMTQDDVRLQVVIADCLHVLFGRKIRLRAECEERFRAACLAAIEREIPIPDRHVLGLALGRLGDPRIVIDLRQHDSDAFVRIEAGEYAYQDGRQIIDQPFWLSRYLVTNSQYEVFIQDDGYQNRLFWSDDGWTWRQKNDVTEPQFWKHPRWNNANQPVVGVSWYEAEAFCLWAGGHLPTVRQWEAAARGKSGREYPWEGEWKDGICNSDEAGLGETSTVGLFRRSRTPDGGVEDMAGNVWEWCQYAFGPKSRNPGRVVRGGSWVDRARYCRSAFHIMDWADDHLGYQGFRVCLVSGPGSRAQLTEIKNR